VPVSELKIIYGLSDPRITLIRYIGQTIHGPGYRIKGHIVSAKSGAKLRVYSWIRKLLREGVEPVETVLEIIEGTQADLDWAETNWILQYRLAGVDLTNCTDGGKGIRGHKHTKITKRKLSRASKGHPKSQGHRAKISAAAKGKSKSPEHRAKIAEVRTGTTASKDTCAKMSRSHTGVYPSQETRDKMSNARKMWHMRKAISQRTEK
jgi:hypothetical protein